MEIVVGKLKSIVSEKVFRVKWDNESNYVWIEKETGSLLMVGENVVNSEDAIECARIYIDRAQL